MDYLFGKATGRPHNIERSKQMFDELKKIGIYDTPENRNMIELNLAKTYNNPNSVSKVELIEKELKDGSLLKYTSTTRESFIMDHTVV